MSEEKKTFPKLLTIADLTTRWNITRQSLHDKKKNADFPKPVQYVSNGRTALYLESDIINYEEKNWWVSSVEGRSKRAGFMWQLRNK